MSIRTDKVASEIKRAISRVMDDVAREHSLGMLTVTGVRMSADLSIASVNISIYGTQKSHKDVLTKLDFEKYRMKRAVATALRLRVIPEFRFYADETLDEIDRITEILKANPPFNPTEVQINDESAE